MNKVAVIVALIVVFGFVSCTDNTETIEQQNEKFELLGTDKGNIGGEEEPDYRED